ncbi:MAG: hypothetical protein K2K63_02630 [Acetatifactor sp.]|nr:hypothetical protein [Acetatifactor sp.]
MNIHKEKCKKLKAIRKKLADGLGIDLKQKECTFEGECRGTCPKCRQEEEALNRALLGKAAAVAVSAGIMLTGCQGETGNTGNPSGRSNIDWEKIFNLDFLKGGKWGETTGAPYPEELPGNMLSPQEELELDGDIMMPPSEEFELEGLMPMDYEIAGEIEPGYDENVPVYENEE